MSRKPSSYIVPRDPAARRKPTVRPNQTMDHYRALHGPHIRQYYSVGDPIRDREATFNRLKIFITALAIIGGMILVFVIAKKG